MDYGERIGVKLDDIVRGNGSIGLRSKQEKLETRLGAIEKNLGDNKKIMVGVAISVALMVIETAWQIVLAYQP
jgi:hypothetical protein